MSNFLVVGYGSIGERHARNLATLGASVVVYDSDEARRRAAAAAGLNALADLAGGLAGRPRAVLVCTPPVSHVAVATAAAAAGCHLFIEKPLSHALAGTADLQDLAERRRLVALVACNMRFHPAIRRLRQELDQGAFGRLLSARAEFGHYLPNWRPGSDYRDSYSAREGEGGGIILDAIHELDYLIWFLGDVVEVACLRGKVSDLELEGEDTAEILLRSRSGVLASVHVDCTQRHKRRRCVLVGSEGTVIWESRGKMPERMVLERFSAKTDQWSKAEETMDPNRPYLDEMAHFLRCLDRVEEPLHSLRDARRTLEVALAARTAAMTRATVVLSES